jgi:hypothetical protein
MSKLIYLCNKALLIKIIIFIFSFFYLLRQTSLNQNLIELLLIVLTILILSFNTKKLLIFSHNDAATILFIVWSLLISATFSLNLKDGLIQSLKLIILITLFLNDRENNFSGTKCMLAGFIFAFFIITIFLKKLS